MARAPWGPVGLGTGLPSRRPCGLGPREAGGGRPHSAHRRGPPVASPLLSPFPRGVCSVKPVAGGLRPRGSRGWVGASVNRSRCQRQEEAHHVSSRESTQTRSAHVAVPFGTVSEVAPASRGPCPHRGGPHGPEGAEPGGPGSAGGRGHPGAGAGVTGLLSHRSPTRSRRCCPTPTWRCWCPCSC